MMGGYNSQEITEEYNGYKFELVTINNQNLWRVEVNDEIKTFSYSPSQLENINLSEEEKRTGFYKGGKFSPKTNVDDNGNIVSHKVADYLYRKEYFEKYGNPYNAPLSRY